MADTPTIQADQVADAFNAVPGAFILIEGDSPSSNILLGASYTQFMPESGGGIAFNVPVAGKYIAYFTFDYYASGGSTSSQFELVFDEGESYAQTIGDTDNWRVRCVDASDHVCPVFVAKIELTAGNHTIKGYGKEINGSNAVILAESSKVTPPTAWLHLISGSGAGGTLSDEKILSAAWTSSASHDVWQDVDNGGGDALTLTFNCAEGDDVLVILHSTVEKDTAAGAIFSRLVLDGTPLAATQIGEYNPDTDAATCMAYPWLLRNLSAGSHTVKVQARSSIASSITFVWDSGTGDTARGQPTLQYLIFRGGQVPIEQAGVEKTATPRAIDFEDFSVEVDNTGKAIIRGGGFAPGHTVEMLNVVGTVTTVTNTSFEDMTGYSGSFDIPVTGKYKLDFITDGFATVADCGGRYQLVFDAAGTPIIVGNDDESWQIDTAASPDTRAYRICTEEVDLEAGSHTIKVQWKRVGASGTWNANASTSVIVRGTLVSGSGAGGVLSNSKTLAAIFSSSATHENWQDIDNGGGDALTLDFDCAEGDDVLVVLNANLKTGASGDTLYLRLALDDSPVAETQCASRIGSASSINTGNQVWILRGVAAGSHTVKVQGRSTTANQWQVDWTTGTGNTDRGKPALQYAIFRGGTATKIVVADTSVAASPRALTAADQGKVFTNEGATAENHYDLPSASPGLRFGPFVVQDTDGMQINAATGDTIRIAGSVSGAAGDISTTTVGNTVTLVAINTTEWIAESYVGTWTVT